LTDNSQKRCFVIGPIGEDDSERRVHADWLFSEIIEPVFSKHFPNFIVERADKISTPGMVTAQIINRLYEAELVIADLSFHNANAFYELAIRHNVGKPIIHMVRKNEDIPFDVIPHRAIKFAVSRPSDLANARDSLLPAIREAVAAGFEPDNPIIHAPGKLELQRNASPEMKVISDEVAQLREQLVALQRSIRRPNTAPSTTRPWAAKTETGESLGDILGRLEIITIGPKSPTDV
jgi:hypothetical protein